MKECRHLWYGYCSKCGKFLHKNYLHRIYTDKYIGGNLPHVIGYLCEDCFAGFCEEFEISM
jgi:hypothetical protein